jgi:hypothetical protein
LSPECCIGLGQNSWNARVDRQYNRNRVRLKISADGQI